MLNKLFILFIVFFCNIVCGQSTLKLPELSLNATPSQTLAFVDSIEARMKVEYYKSNYVDVLRYGEKGIALTDSLNDVAGGLKISKYLGSALIRMKDTVRAKKLFTESLQTARLLEDSLLIASAINNLGNFYNELENLDKAAQYYHQAIAILENLDSKRELYILHYNLSNIYLSMGNISKAKIHIDELSKRMGDFDSPLFKSGYYLCKGKILMLQNQPEKAIIEFEESVRIAKSFDYRDGIIYGYEGYLEALIETKDFERAHYIRLNLNEYTNNKYELEKLAAINEVTSRMNVDQYKQELKAKNLENELNRQKAYESQVTSYLVIAASLILAGLLIFVFISSKNRKKLVANLQEKNVLYLNAKKKAEDLSKVKTEFLSAISHELRTPLYGIIGISSILRDEVLDQRHEEDLKSLKFSADYLLSLINDLLFLNKLEASKNDKLEKKPFEPRKLVTNIVNSFEFMRSKNNNDFVINIDDTVPAYLRGDHHKLSQILMNLIGNACKFTDEGTITIGIMASRRRKGGVSLDFSIADNGRGISKKLQKTIFDEFTQDTQVSNFQGSGLGLSIVKRLLDLHNAPIKMISEKNIGTDFKFTIAYQIADETEFETRQKIEKVEKDIEGSRILIVDDNRINRLVTRKILERNSYVCSMASNGREAVEILEKEVFDLILMDVNMPVMNGFEATSAIRKFNKTIPIIALTARDPIQIEDDFIATGMTDIIIKPYETVEFLEIIKRNFLVTLEV